jgi:UDP-glucose:glycoprotein glucosyltransferase
MMYSVSIQKKSDRKLKFWLFDSFVSPGFRDSIRKMAEALKFEFEFISYKWPTWLLHQKTKMRTVWAYKILFLDVVFPIRPEVDRVIFVDADQVARADLSDLAEFDMENQVYGFVPFCEDRPEMSSYKFWNTPGSYWDQVLQGKPYYIRYVS